jgi:hypothetical protein
MRQTGKQFWRRLGQVKAMGLRQFKFTGKAPAVCIRGAGGDSFISLQPTAPRGTALFVHVGSLEDGKTHLKTP